MDSDSTEYRKQAGFSGPFPCGALLPMGGDKAGIPPAITYPVRRPEDKKWSSTCMPLLQQRQKAIKRSS